MLNSFLSKFKIKYNIYSNFYLEVYLIYNLQIQYFYTSFAFRFVSLTHTLWPGFSQVFTSIYIILLKKCLQESPCQKRQWKQSWSITIDFTTIIYLTNNISSACDFSHLRQRCHMEWSRLQSKGWVIEFVVTIASAN